MQSGSQVWVPTAARKMNRQSLATGRAPVLTGCPQSPAAAHAEKGRAVTKIRATLTSESPIGPARILGHPEVLVGREILHLAGDLALVGRGIELGDGADAAAPGFHAVPRGLQIVAKGADAADTGDDDSSFAHDV